MPPPATALKGRATPGPRRRASGRRAERRAGRFRMVKVPSPPGKTSSARARSRAVTRGLTDRVPGALAALLGVAAVIGLAWALVSPALQTPDENSHAAYVQSLGTRFALPGDAHRQM